MYLQMHSPIFDWKFLNFRIKKDEAFNFVFFRKMNCRATLSEHSDDNKIL